jgi:isopenicillin N synthase-like dioxygenase
VRIFAQDEVGGLKTHNTLGERFNAAPSAGSLVVNVGNMMARRTHEQFVSATHRVISVPRAVRYSVPVFFDPNFDADLSAPPICTGPHNPPSQRPPTAGRLLRGGVTENVADLRDHGAAG